LDLADGDYIIDTGSSASDLPVLKTASGTVLKTGVNYNQGVPASAPYWGYNPWISVFSFDDIRIGTNPRATTVTVVGQKPLSLLSRNDIAFLGVLDAGGANGANGTGNLGGDGDGAGGRGGPGGGRGGDGGIGKGENGSGPGNADPVIDPGTREIGGFGGGGGLGSRGNGAGFGGRGGGGFGGLVEQSNYGDEWLTYLQAGAGGGGTGRDLFLSKGAGGGGGGGAVELGAIESIRLFTDLSQVVATGGGFGTGGTVLSGGGSGGGILVHANSIVGGAYNASAGGPNGGGGRIVFLDAIGRPQDSPTAYVNNGNSGGEPGTVRTGVQQMQRAADNVVARFTTGSPVSLSQTVAGALPGADFNLTFTTLFETTTGVLQVFLDSILLGTINAPAVPDSAFVAQSLGIAVGSFAGSSHLLSFLFDGPTGSRLLLDDVVFPGLVNGGFQTGLSPWIAAGPGDVGLIAVSTDGAVPVPVPVPVPTPLALIALAAGLLALGRRRPAGLVKHIQSGRVR
jgi:hypothetical protein